MTIFFSIQKRITAPLLLAVPPFELSRRTNLPPVISLGQVRKVEFPWYYKAQTIKNLPAMQETWVRSLGREDPLETRMAPRSSIRAWRTPWTEEPGGLHTVHGVVESDTTE